MALGNEEWWLLTFLEDLVLREGNGWLGSDGSEQLEDVFDALEIYLAADFSGNLQPVDAVDYLLLDGVSCWVWTAFESCSDVVVKAWASVGRVIRWNVGACVVVVL